MKVIPVIDLLGGQVVHAVRGEREKYMPVESCLVPGSNPLDIAGALLKETGCSQIYIADLDSIRKKGSNSRVITGIKEELGVSLLVDSAAFDAESAVSAKNFGADTVIVGSETFFDLSEFARMTDKIPADDLLFSIDISGRKVISGADELKGKHPVEAVNILSEKGAGQFILLTLDAVGSGEGPDTWLMKRMRRKFPDHTLIAGGGVRYPCHLEQLKTAGADGVLVATSLHKGWITGDDIFLL